ncbi:MAG: hypothetical protein U0165_07665 [Polyangiaceae bacterium]
MGFLVPVGEVLPEGALEIEIPKDLLGRYGLLALAFDRFAHLEPEHLGELVDIGSNESLGVLKCDARQAALLAQELLDQRHRRIELLGQLGIVEHLFQRHALNEVALHLAQRSLELMLAVAARVSALPEVFFALVRFVSAEASGLVAQRLLEPTDVITPLRVLLRADVGRLCVGPQRIEEQLRIDERLAETSLLWIESCGLGRRRGRGAGASECCGGAGTRSKRLEVCFELGVALNERGDRRARIEDHRWQPNFSGDLSSDLVEGGRTLTQTEHRGEQTPVDHLPLVARIARHQSTSLRAKETFMTWLEANDRLAREEW